jgi:hypothetical protein
LSKGATKKTNSLATGTLVHVNTLLFVGAGVQPVNPDNFKSGIFDDFFCIEPDVFFGLTTLKTFSLNSDEYYRVPIGLFDGLTNLESVSLTGQGGNGGISDGSLPKDIFKGLKKVRTLDLSGNNIDFNADVDPRIFAGMKSLRTLKISWTNGSPDDYKNTKQNLIRTYCGCNVDVVTS